MSKTEILSATYGIAPRSDELLERQIDLGKGRISPEDVAPLEKTEMAQWTMCQVKAKIDRQDDGKLTWPDYLRPIVRASEGFAADIDGGPVTRWFDTNTFYRQPAI